MSPVRNCSSASQSPPSLRNLAVQLRLHFQLRCFKATRNHNSLPAAERSRHRVAAEKNTPTVAPKQTKGRDFVLQPALGLRPSRLLTQSKLKGRDFVLQPALGLRPSKLLAKLGHPDFQPCDFSRRLVDLQGKLSCQGAPLSPEVPVPGQGSETRHKRRISFQHHMNFMATAGSPNESRPPAHELHGNCRKSERIWSTSAPN